MSFINPFSINIISIQDFLTKEFQSGASYGTINSYRSALSLILGPEIAQDPEVRRICKGAAKLRPPHPKYDLTWDPKIVLDFLSKWEPNSEILLEKLTYKLVTLLALVTAQRMQTLALIDIKEIKLFERRIQIKIPAPIKTSKPGRNQPTLILPFFKDKKICAAKTLLDYLDRTKEIRGNEVKLFISFKRPHKPVGSQTLSRWIKNVLSDSGIDTEQFSAYSTRHASTSAAKRMGVGIDFIRSTAGWTKNSKTFAKFYSLQISDDRNVFAQTILKL